MAEQVARDATLSEDGLYRYDLWRRWGKKPGHVVFIGLNPSTADATNDDPTIRRCIGFARAWGYEALCMVNLFAYRATDPGDMMAARDPIGPDNDYFLMRSTSDADLVVAAWGNGGGFLGRGKKVRGMVPGLQCLRVTGQGHPGHPLFLKGDLKPFPWTDIG